MSRILDCPHCNHPLTSLRVGWVAMAEYQATAKMEASTREGLVYKIAAPVPNSHPVRILESTPSYYCPFCSGPAFDPGAAGWGVREMVSSTEGNGIVIYDENRMMEDKC